MAKVSGNFILTASLAGIGIPLFGSGLPNTVKRPNVVIILTDDMGYGDIFMLQ